MHYNSGPKPLKCYKKSGNKTRQLRFQQDGISERLIA